MKFISLIDGDLLNANIGNVTGGILITKVKIVAPSVKLNHEPRQNIGKTKSNIYV